MSQHPTTPFGIRIRLIVLSVMVGFALGGYCGIRYVTRNDSAAVQRIFEFTYLPARLEHKVGIRPLGGVLQPTLRANSWVQQFPVMAQWSYWRARFAGRIRAITHFALAGAVLFGLLALRLTRRRMDPSEIADGRHLRRNVRRPWE